jgi:hypothetical protein
MCLYFQGVLEYDPHISVVTGPIPSKRSAKITSMCAITVSPMHATCLTQFIHDFISRGEETTNALILTLYAPSNYFLCHRFKCSPNNASLHTQECWRKRTLISREGSTQKRPKHKKQ